MSSRGSLPPTVQLCPKCPGKKSAFFFECERRKIEECALLSTFSPHVPFSERRTDSQTALKVGASVLRGGSPDATWSGTASSGLPSKRPGVVGREVCRHIFHTWSVWVKHPIEMENPLHMGVYGPQESTLIQRDDVLASSEFPPRDPRAATSGASTGANANV